MRTSAPNDLDATAKVDDAHTATLAVTFRLGTRCPLKD